MRLNGFGMSRLAENLQQVVVGQEVETREDLPFSFEVHVQRFLNLFEFCVHVVQFVIQTCKLNYNINASQDCYLINGYEILNPRNSKYKIDICK